MLGWAQHGAGHAAITALQHNLQQLAASLDAAGLPLPAFQELYITHFGAVLQAAQYGELNVPDLITR